MDRRSALKTLSAIALGAPLALTPAQVFARADYEDILADVHPQLRPAARLMFEKGYGSPSMGAHSYRESRKIYDRMSRPPATDIPYERRVIPGMAGHPDIEIYVINLDSSKRRPAILHMHGGGYVTGSAKSMVPDLQDICRSLDCTAVTVEYRLAPETRYDGSIEDNYAALRWLHGNAALLGVDPLRIAVMGESAGGGHAALLAITARDRGEVPLCFQCLTYPMLDDRTGSSRAVPGHVGKIIWDVTSNRFGWESFLGTTPGWANVPARGVPARTADLSGLPPAFVGVGAIDLFVEEDMEYARRLVEANVPAELIVVPGAFHGFDFMAVGTPVANDFRHARLESLRSAFAASK
jgi:acetyl esterase/lipase